MTIASKCDYAYVAIDSNNNVTIPLPTKKLMIDALMLNYAEDTEFERDVFKRTTTFEVYKIPHNLQVFPCSCMINIIKKRGKLEERSILKAKFQGMGCKAKRHDWKVTDTVTEKVASKTTYVCDICNTVKVKLDIKKCVYCGEKLQPFSCVVPQWSQINNKSVNF